MLLTLETVYAARNPKGSKDDVYEKLLPTFVISGNGTVDVYASNAATKPANYSAMVKAESALAVGCHTLVGDVMWLCFVAASGSPVVNEKGVVD